MAGWFPQAGASVPTVSLPVFSPSYRQFRGCDARRACVTQSIWSYLIQHFGNPRFLAHLTWYAARFIRHSRIGAYSCMSHGKNAYFREQNTDLLTGLFREFTIFQIGIVRYFSYEATFTPGESARMDEG